MSMKTGHSTEPSSWPSSPLSSPPPLTTTQSGSEEVITSTNPTRLVRRLTKTRRPGASLSLSSPTSPPTTSPVSSSGTATSSSNMPHIASLSSTTSSSATAASTASDVGSLASLASLSSATSIGAIGRAVPRDQPPRFLRMPLRTPTWDDESGSVSLVASASIAAPMAAAVALVLDARTYPRWNRFHPSLTVHEIQRSVVALPRCLRRSEALVRIENNTTTLREGVAFTVAVAMDLGATRAPGSRALRESPAQVVSVLEEFERDGRVGVRLAWRIRNKTQGWIMRSERVQEFLPAEHDPYGAVDYVVWETFHGLFASSLPTIWGKSIHHGFVAMINGLKHHAEASARGLEPDWRGDDKLRRRP